MIPGLHQRPDQGDGAGGIAAGVGHAIVAVLIADRWLLHSSGKPKVQPSAVRCAVEASMTLTDGVADQADRLARRVVRQAEDHQVGGVEQLGPGGGVLAAFGRDRQQLEVRAADQPLADLQAGGAGLAVDENPGLTHWPIPCVVRDALRAPHHDE
jgi:hypothetical protein